MDDKLMFRVIDRTTEDQKNSAVPPTTIKPAMPKPQPPKPPRSSQ